MASSSPFHDKGIRIETCTRASDGVRVRRRQLEMKLLPYLWVIQSEENLLMKGFLWLSLLAVCELLQLFTVIGQ